MVSSEFWIERKKIEDSGLELSIFRFLRRQQPGEREGTGVYICRGVEKVSGTVSLDANKDRKHGRPLKPGEDPLQEPGNNCG